MAQVPRDLLDRIRRLEAEVAALRGRANIRPALNQVIDGDVHIGSGGRLILDDGDGSVLMYAGDILPDYEDGSTQRGIIFWRADGMTALTQAASDLDPTKTQQIAIWDSQGNATVATDPDGLALPYLPIPMYPAPSALWPTVTGTGWSDMWTGTMPRQQGGLYVTALGACAGGGATGELRLLANGNQIGGTSSHNSSAFSWGQWFGAAPAGGWGSDLVLTLQGRMTSGAGSIFARVDYAFSGGAA